MAHRHKHKNIGGGTWYNAKGTNVQAEAEEKNKGGPVAKRKVGGRAVGKPGGMLTGGRLDKRARGGRTGSDKSPFSSASATPDRGKRSEVSGAHAHAVGHARGGSVKKK